MTDKTNDTFIEDDETEQLKVVADAIAQLMGGSASDYALEQLGNGVFSMVFNEESEVTLDDFIEKLTATAEASKLEIPAGASPLNVFDESATKMIQ